MKPLVLALVVVLQASVVASPVWAEEGERSLGVEAALLLPAFASESPTAFALATWRLGGFAQYGVFEDFSLLTRVSFAAFRGSTARTETFVGRQLPGVLHFATTELGLEVGGRYKLFSGYRLAPYVDVTGGVLFATYRGQRLVNAAGVNYGLSINDRKELSMTTSVGVAADYRIVNLFFLGLSLRYAQVWGGMSAHAVIIPLEFSYYW